MAFQALLSVVILIFLGGCFSTQVRLPSSANQVFKNTELQQVLLLAAQNNILFHIPDSTIREVEKTEIDAKCREIDEPLWAEKLSSYLAEFRRHPEYLSRFHIMEIKRGDDAGVQIQKDLDGAVTVSLQFVKIESRGKVQLESKLPCNGSLAEYLGRELVKTDFEFPSDEQFRLALQKLPERVSVPRLQFANDFTSYLAERGVIFKFNHEMSFERTTKGKYVLAELMNQMSQEIKDPFHKYINYWFQQISEKSIQAQVIQMFAILPDREQKSGVKVESEADFSRKIAGESDLTYVYTSYSIENEQIKFVTLKDLDQCLQGFTNDMSGVKLRKPASTEKTSYLKPGYACAPKTEITDPASSARPPSGTNAGASDN